jgi:iron(III) transport system permease protein
VKEKSEYIRWAKDSRFWWSLGIGGLAAALSTPILVIIGYLFVPTGEVWSHLARTVLKDYISNSLLLMIGVSFGSLFIGVGTAWLAAMCRFPGRKIFEWMLLLPMAMPAYIIAYTYTGMLDYSGPVQSALRSFSIWGGGSLWFPEIRSLWGAIAMLSLVLYPYVYLLARAAFLSQSLCVLEVSRSLGCGPWRTFATVALPLARPSIVAGLSLALMETLADYGTVSYFGVSTFTTGIFRTWYGLDNAPAAAQLSALLLMLVFGLIILERAGRRHAKYHDTGQRYQVIRRIPLRGKKAALAFIFCGTAVLLGFLLPAGQLAYWAVTVSEEVIDAEFLKIVGNSLFLGGIGSLLALILALFFGYGQRLYSRRIIRLSVRISAMGYAIPGTVVAIGVIIPLAWIDNTFDGWMRSQFNVSTGLLLSGGLVALLFAYLVRFLAVSLQTVEAGLGRIKPSLDEAARSLGNTPNEVLRWIHLPMLKGSLMTAVLLVFVDVLKELPATLILRPFNYNTLSVRAYELATDERLADAAPASLAIVAAGIIPVILLSNSITRSRRTD